MPYGRRPLPLIYSVVAVFVFLFHCFAKAQPSTGSDRAYSQVVADLTNAGVPVRQLHGRGHVAVTLAAGRVVALAFTQDGPNLFRTNPKLGNTKPEELEGDFGGDRLWFSPEPRYHWCGVPDWEFFSNYKPPRDTDPGRYDFRDEGPDTIALAAQGEIPDQCLKCSVKGGMKFKVERRVRMTESPLALDHPLMRDVDYVGIETTHHLSIDETTKAGEIDLWHLLQMPVDSILIVPLKPGHKTEPLSYGMQPGKWETSHDRVIWRFEGKSNTKLGLPAKALTGRSAVLRKLGADRWCLIIRQFPADPAARYGDHPWGIPRDDQVFQAWDGFGFGEMEYHSPVLDAERGPRMLDDRDQLWAFGGSAHAVASLADTLLGVDVRPLF